MRTSTSIELLFFQSSIQKLGLCFFYTTNIVESSVFPIDFVFSLFDVRLQLIRCGVLYIRLLIGPWTSVQ